MEFTRACFPILQLQLRPREQWQLIDVSLMVCKYNEVTLADA